MKSTSLLHRFLIVHVHICYEGNGKVRPRTDHEGPEEEET
jgi:hypothetical protein